LTDVQQPKKVELKLDLRGTLEIANVGVRRAAAFLKIGDQIQELELPDDFAISGGVAYSFWPNPLPAETKETLRNEFQSWIIGSCLKELEQHFSLFLDRAWHEVGLADLHGSTKPSSFMIKPDEKFSGDTNSASKAEKFLAKTGIELDLECLQSLSKARNALAHGLGQVHERQVNTDNNSLQVSWIGTDLVLIDGEKEIIYSDKPVDTYQVKSEDGAPLEMRRKKRTKEFVLGERIQFSQHELAEICMFYSQQAAKVHNELVGYLKTKGISEAEKKVT